MSRRRRRLVAWALLVMSVYGLITSVLSTSRAPLTLVFAAMLALAISVLREGRHSDVLGDHPAEIRRAEPPDFEAIRLERETIAAERRLRGEAGWQKPVRPPAEGRYPGGLPPRER